MHALGRPERALKNPFYLLPPPTAGKIVFLRPFKGRRKNQTVWDAVWIDAASEWAGVGRCAAPHAGAVQERPR